MTAASIHPTLTSRRISPYPADTLDSTPTNAMLSARPVTASLSDPVMRYKAAGSREPGDWNADPRPLSDGADEFYDIYGRAGVADGRYQQREFIGPRGSEHHCERGIGRYLEDDYDTVPSRSTTGPIYGSSLGGPSALEEPHQQHRYPMSGQPIRRNVEAARQSPDPMSPPAVSEYYNYHDRNLTVQDGRRVGDVMRRSDGGGSEMCQVIVWNVRVWES